MSDVHFVKNENGNVHSVDTEHFEEYCHTTVRGSRYLKPGWSEIDEDEARRLNPQLFGARDRNVVRTAEELKEIIERRKLEEELAGWEAEQDALDEAIDAEIDEAELTDEPKTDGLLPAPARKGR